MTPDEPIQLGRYQVLGELGRGAMGTVYLAQDPLLKRGLAIKVVSGGSLQEEAHLRFKREAEIAAKLHHPNIVSIFDVGTDPTFGSYLAMEYVEGESLQEKLQRGPLSPAMAVELLAQAALALETAHRVGIIHRDIKPGNFMVSEHGSLKLMDFGIARSMDSLHQSALLCTPAYASPELLNGMQPSEADDRWAFAAMAFQCLAGRVPFESASIAGTLSAIANGVVVFPEGFDPALVRVLTKAFAKDPAQRHGDLRTFMLDLMSALPLDSRTPAKILIRLGWQDTSPQTATHASFRLRPWQIATGAALSVLIVGAILLYWGQSPGKVRPITILSTPPGADVRVNGSYLGKTPITNGFIPEKADRLELKLKDHAPLSRYLGSDDKRIVVQLTPLPWEMDVSSKPSGAKVFLNDVAKGTTPLRNIEVPGHGTHRLELKLEGYQTWAMTVSKNRQPPETIVLEPEPKGSDSLRTLKQKFKKLWRE